MGKGDERGWEGGTYQSIDWGGSSFEGDVLTVSTQPGWSGIYQPSAPALLARWVPWEDLTRDGELSLTLQESAVGHDERLCLHPRKAPLAKLFICF